MVFDLGISQDLVPCPIIDSGQNFSETCCNCPYAPAPATKI